MRINVYTEELPDGSVLPAAEIVTADYVSSRTGKPMTNYGLRVYLKSPPELHYIPGRDDDRSAVTFWCGSKQSNVLHFVEQLKGVAEVDNLNRFRDIVAAANETKCKNADRYKAINPPRCNGGKPCDVCRRKWKNRKRT